MPRRRRPAAALVLALAALLAVPAAGEGPAAAAGEEPAAVAGDGDERPFGFGGSFGYAHAAAVRDVQVGNDVAQVETLTFEPQLRLQWFRAGGGGAWYHGALDATLEGLLAVELSPASGYLLGASAGLRYRLRPIGRFEPFGDGALGLGGLDFDLASQDDGFTFFLQAGLGARVRVDERSWLTASLRWQHFSNAQLRLPNAGIDTFGFRVGLER